MNDTKTIVDYIDNTGQALGLALNLVKQASEEQEKAADAIPEVVDLLISSALISRQEEKLAREKLSSHSDTLQVFASTIEHLLQKHAEELKNANAKSASLNQGRPENKPAARVSSTDSDAPLLRMTSLRHLVEN